MSTKPFYKSKKFLSSFATLALIIANDVYQLGLQDSTIENIITIVAGYVVAQGIADVNPNKKEVVQ